MRRYARAWIVDIDMGDCGQSGGRGRDTTRPVFRFGASGLPGGSANKQSVSLSVGAHRTPNTVTFKTCRLSIGTVALPVRYYVGPEGGDMRGILAAHTSSLRREVGW